jgi:Zn-dependent protease
MGIAGAFILIASVLLHELSHSIMAIRYGLRVRRITLFIFGGVAEIEEKDEEEETRKNYHHEFNIAVVGPITSFLLAAIFVLLWLAAGGTLAEEVGADPMSVKPEYSVIAEGIFLYSTIINALLGGFNLLPAFPMDGGRMLRAALTKYKKDYDKATRIAVRTGIAISYAMMGFGFLTILGGSFVGGIWLILIGWFIQSGAQSYLSQHELSRVLSGVRLKDIMKTSPITLNPSITVDDALNNYFNTFRKTSFPVIDGEGFLLGMVTVEDIMKIPAEKRISTTVEMMKIPRSKLLVLESESSALSALIKMARSHTGRVFICDTENRLIGIVSKTDVMEAANERQEFIKAADEK